MVESISSRRMADRFGSLQAGGRCAKCGSATMVDTGSDGERICGRCGLVVAERSVDQGPEPRRLNGDGTDKARVGAPTSITLGDMGLSTVIGRRDRDASGRALGAEMRSAMIRLRRWDYRSPVCGSERGLVLALSEQDRTAEKLGLPKAVREQGAYIYRKALARGLVRGRSIKGLSAAALYAAIRDSETPRTLKDIAAANDMHWKDVARYYRKLLREMDLTMPVADAARSVHGIASRVGLSEKVARRAINIVNMIRSREISPGKCPLGLAAVALYVAGALEGEFRTQKEIAWAAGITEVTVRNRYKGLRADLGSELGL